MSRNNIIYGDKHTFTSYSNDEVYITGGSGQQLTIQGSIDIIDKYNDNALIKINGNPIMATTGALYLDDLSDVQVSTVTAQYLQLLVLTGGGNWVNSNYVGGLKFQATTMYDFAVGEQDYVWADLIGEPNVRGGASAPTYSEITGSNGWYNYEFNHSGGDKYVYSTFHIPHDFKADSGLHFHVHFCNAWTTNTDSGVVRFEILTTVRHGNQALSTQYNYNQVFPTTVSIGAIQGGRDYIAETVDEYMNSDIRVDDLVEIRLKRDNTVSGNYPQPVWVQLIDLHYKSNKVGTKNRVAPFYS